MNVVLAQVVLNLRAQNVVFLREQLRAANDRLAAREGTPTDVAQANGALQGGLAGYAAASPAVTSALATYEQVIGHRPERLAPRITSSGTSRRRNRRRSTAVSPTIRQSWRRNSTSTSPPTT